MTHQSHLRRVACAAVMTAACAVLPGTAAAQGTVGAPGSTTASATSNLMREGSTLDLQGRTAEARVIFQRLIDSATTPAARAVAHRAMAMSYAFDGDCANAGRQEAMVIAYWVTREQAEPQNAFYQQGEMANEAARVCIDAGDLAAADKWYRTGYALGVKEPAPQTHPQSLWNFRLAHALGRLAARRGDAAEAQRQVEKARQLLDSDSAMAAQQERFFPYLVGYVALYGNDLQTAAAELAKAISLRGNEKNPFMHYLLGMTHERMGHMGVADPLYRQAYAMATAHNPPSAFVRHALRTKFGDTVATDAAASR